MGQVEVERGTREVEEGWEDEDDDEGGELKSCIFVASSFSANIFVCNPSSAGWDDKEKSILEGIGAGSANLAAQLARIEALAFELESDFARTGSELTSFKRALDEGLKESCGKQLESRMNVVDYENEVLERRNRDKRKESRRIKRGGDIMTMKSESVKGAEEEIGECWEIIEELRKGLYTK